MILGGIELSTLKTIKLCTRGLLALALVYFCACSSSPPGLIILCAGDSITAAEYPRYLQRSLRGDGIRVQVLNYGRDGNTSGEYLDFLKVNVATLTADHPHFVLLQLGTNDVREDGDKTSAGQFEANMTEIIHIFAQFKTRSGKATRIVLATIPPIPEGTSFPFSRESRQRVISEINPRIYKLAKNNGLALVDNHYLFSRHPHLLPDVHPSKEGYRELAKNWYQAIKPMIH
ncbi:SGNH/GDSL hydrolase family protein [Acidobacteriota bacterium]